jgi:hypothetical protein
LLFPVFLFPFFLVCCSDLLPKILLPITFTF